MIVAAASRTSSIDRYVMIGDGATRAACERQANELGVGDRFEFTGRLGHREALARLARCDMLLSPHVPLPGGEEFFGSPTKIFEYMALSLPIIASDLGQIGEVLSDGVNALLIEPGSISGLAAAIDELAADPELAARLADRAGRDAQALHGWEQRAEAILAAVAGA